MIAMDNEEVIAHLALDVNRRANTVQILLPAIEPRYRNQLFKLIRAFWKMIKLQAMRQNWGLIFEYNLSVQPLLQVLLQALRSAAPERQ